MNKILCSTGAIVGRPNGRDFTLLGKYRDFIDCDGYEFMMYDTWYERIYDLKEYILKLGISIPVFHVEKSIGELITRNQQGDFERALELFELNCDLAMEFGAKTLVLHLWNGVESDKNIEHNIACFKFLKTVSDSYGIALTVENVVCAQKDPMSHMIALIREYPNIEFTFDTKMAAFHNQLDMICMEEYLFVSKKIRHMHINDYGGGYKDFQNLRTLHIGKGNIDFSRVFSHLKKINYNGDFTVEATSFGSDGNVNHQELNNSLNILRSNLKNCHWH